MWNKLEDFKVSLERQCEDCFGNKTKSSLSNEHRDMLKIAVQKSLDKLYS